MLSEPGDSTPIKSLLSKPGTCTREMGGTYKGARGPPFVVTIARVEILLPLFIPSRSIEL